jgi:hypothetical protein
MPRVVEVDVGVPQPVQDEHSPAFARVVDLHRGAVVLRLDIAATRGDRRADPHHEQQDSRA